MRYWVSDSTLRFKRRVARALGMMLSVPLLAAFIAVSLPAAPIIQYQLTSLGTNGSGQVLFQYNYTLSGIDLLVNQELDIQFDPTVFSQLSNGVAGPGFDLLLFQPNQPVGEQGDYSALALISHPAIGGPFSVDVTLVAGVATPPASQIVFIYDDNFSPSHVLFQGLATQAVVGPAVPEPWSFFLCSVGLAAFGVSRAVRRRGANTA